MPANYQSTFVSKRQISPEIFEFTFSVGPDFVFQPGQYVWVVLPRLDHDDPKGERRAFSITSSTSDRGKITILTTPSESGYKKTLFSLVEGAPVIIRGPHGSAFVLDGSQGNNVCFVAGHYGIAAFLSHLRSHDQLPKSISLSLVTVGLTQADEALLHEITELCHKYQIPFVNMESQFQLNALSVIPQWQSATFCISGSQVVVDDVAKKLSDQGITPSRLRFEQNYPETPGANGDMFTEISRQAKNPFQIRKNLVTRVFVFYCISGTVMGLLQMALFTFQGKSFSETIVLSSLAVLYSAILGIYVVSRNITISLQAMLGATLFLVLWTLSSGQIGGIAIYWLYFFPFLPFFFLGRVSGVLWNITYLLSLGIVYFLAFIGATPFFYDPQHIVQSLLSVGFISFYAYFLNAMSETFEHNLSASLVSESKFRLAVESSSNHIIITDPSGHIVYANQAVQDTTGFRMNEIIGNTPRLWGGFMTPEFYKRMWRSKLSKQPFVGEINNMKKNGEMYTALSRISPILDEKEEIIGYIGMEENITSRIALERQVIEEKNRDEAILLSLGEGVVASDEKGVVIFANKAGVTMLGYSNEDLKGKKFTEVVTAFDVDGNIIPEEKRPITISLKTLQGIEAQLIYQRKDGSRFTCNVTHAPVVVEGKHLGSVQVIRDITKEREIDKAKTEFISLASHQLRTPLSTINWYMEMLLSGDAGTVTAEQKQFLEEAYTGSKRLVRLVNALLNVSRIETGTVMVDPKVVDVIELLNTVLEEVHPLIEKKQLSVNVEKEDFPPIPLDPELMTIVLQNLVTNAVKYTPQNGQISFRLRIAHSGEVLAGKSLSSDCLLIQVADNGMGIPADQQSEIYKKLFRADNARQADTEGSGLGLYLTKSIIDQSHGEIWFTSAEGKGTTFYVTLPLSGMMKKEGTKKLSS